MSTARKNRYLLIRSGDAPTYQRIIPKPLRPFFNGQSAIWKRLSDDLDMARMEAVRLGKHHSALFAKLRSKQFQAGIAKFLGDDLDAFVDPDMILRVITHNLANLDSRKEYIRKLTALDPQWREVMTPDLDTDTLEVAKEILAQRKQLEIIVRENEALEPLAAILTGSSAETVQDVASQWIRATAPARATLNKYRTILHRFYVAVGPDALIDQVTREDIRRFLASIHRSPQTVTGHLQCIRACFNWAISQDKLSTNPTTGIRPPKDNRDASARRRGFSITELRQLRDAIVEAWGPDDDRTLAFLLGCHLGLRLNEIVGLARNDARNDPDTGLMVLDIRPNKFRPLKNTDSTRLLPVPSILSDAVRKRMSANPDRRLMHNIRNAKQLSDHFRELKREVLKLPEKEDARVSFHSIRHSAEDMLRNADIQDALRYRIMGRREAHSSAAGYGSGAGLLRMAQAMMGVDPFALGANYKMRQSDPMSLQP